MPTQLITYFKDSAVVPARSSLVEAVVEGFVVCALLEWLPAALLHTMPPLPWDAQAQPSSPSHET